MKQLTSGALTEVAKTTGTEPVLLVEINWQTGTKTYSSHTIYGFKSKILEIGHLESVIVVDGKQSHNVTVTLDDIDGEIKNITDTVNIHKIPCTVYQCYTSLPVTDKFILFKGQISAPFTWGEDDRTVQFEILSEIESFEVGFSPEEGQLDFVPLDFIGQPWPLSFGSVVHSSATKVHQTLTGTLLEDIGLIDQVLNIRIINLIRQFGDNATILLFNSQIMQAADLIGAPATLLLNNYVTIINTCHTAIKELNTLLTQLEFAKRQEKRDPTSVARRNARIELEQTLDSGSVQLATLENNKSLIEANIDLTVYEYEFKKQAALNQIEAYNGMCHVLYEILLLQQEICRQSKLQKHTFLVEDGHLFPQNTTVEINVKGLKARGKFNDKVFTVDVGPYAKYENLPISDWVKDTDPCEPTDEFNGLATFYLRNVPAETLVGLYCLVKKKGTPDDERHIIKVVRQYGNKCIFELVGRNIATGNPSGISLSKILGKIQNLLNFQTDGDLLSPTGNLHRRLFFDEDLFMRPETIKLVSIIIGILNFSVINDLSVQPELTLDEVDSILRGMFGADWLRVFNALRRLNPDTPPIDQVEAWFKQYFGVTQREIEFLSKVIFVEPMDNLSNIVLIDMPTSRRIFTIIGEDVEFIQQAAGMVFTDWLMNYVVPYEEWPDNFEWKAEAGTIIRAKEDDCQIYISNILPSEIHGVFAYRTTRVDNKRILAPVPSSYYTKNENANLGTINVTALIFPKALREIEGENWEDEIYVTQTSSVGPHICDVLDHLITTYIPGATTDFSAVRNQLDNYPVNFTLLERPNVLEEVARIAWESRCALIRNGSVFKLKYLSKKPTADKTFDLAHIEAETLKIAHSNTDGLATRIIATWNKDYLPLLPHRHLPRWVLRHNVKLYGLHDSAEHFHIYNDSDLVYKSATFWLIRLCNIWEHATFNTTIKNIQLDLYDAVQFELDNILSIRGIVEDIRFDFKEKTLQMSVWLPIRAGESEEYFWAWPADKLATDQFPLPIEIQQGLAGGYGPGSGVTGTIPGC